MDVVEINGLRVTTEVGFSPHERGKLQELAITIHLRISIKKAGESDRVEDTINYKTITKDVLFHVENKKYNLIEAVATDVARICVVRHGVPSVKVIVAKPVALRFCESSSVTIERCWEDFDWQEAHILLGSNKDPLYNLSQAISLLNKKVKVIRLSKAFWTKPVMAGDGAEDFVNIAALIKTKLDAVGLKQVLLGIEHQLEREPKANIIACTIDLDISFYGKDIGEYLLNTAPVGKRRAVPHPDTLKEAYVIIPLADITPDFVHPQSRKSLKTMALEISGRDDFTSFFSTVQHKDFLRMFHNDLEESNSVETALRKDYPGISASAFNAVPVSNGISGPLHTTAPDASKQNGECLSGSIGSLSDTLLVNDVPSSPVVFSNAGQQFSNKLNGTGCHLSDRTLTSEEAPVAMVTGAAKRLGASIVRKLRAEGYRVVIPYNGSKDDATNILREFNSARSNSASLVQGDLACDVSKTAQRIMAEAVGVWGRLDLLVNNASQYFETRQGSVTEELWDKLLHANLTSVFFLSQAAYPFLKESKGSIVNLCDIHGLRPKTNFSVYCISKAGLHMCTFSLAKEFAPDVRVNGVAPGCILWPEISWEGMSLDERQEGMKEYARKKQESIKKIPFGRRGEPENIADAVLFLSRSAEYITGQIIAVDGGRSLHQ